MHHQAHITKDLRVCDTGFQERAHRHHHQPKHPAQQRAKHGDQRTLGGHRVGHNLGAIKQPHVTHGTCFQDRELLTAVLKGDEDSLIDLKVTLQAQNSLLSIWQLLELAAELVSLLLQVLLLALEGDVVRVLRREASRDVRLTDRHGTDVRLDLHQTVKRCLSL